MPCVVECPHLDPDSGGTGTGVSDCETGETEATYQTQVVLALNSYHLLFYSRARVPL